MPERWFENGEFWRDLESKVYSPERWNAAIAEVGAALRLLGVSAPAKILDMGCGNGRHSIEFSRQGHHVTGVDLCGAYVVAARSNPSCAGLSVNFVQGDMRTYRSRESFDAAVILWNAFGYFENDAEDVEALTCIQESLRKGGQLLIQTHGRESTARRFVRKDWFQIGDQFVLDQRWIDNNWSSMRTRYVILGKPGRQEYTMSCRLYSPPELTDLLRASGFEQVRIYGSLEGTPYDEKAFELVAVAQKAL